MKTNPTDLPPYLTEPRYLRELAPLHVINALEDAKGDPEFAALRDELVNAMLRFRDKLADRPVRARK